MAKPVAIQSNGVLAPPKFRHTLWWYISRFLMFLSVILFCVIIAAATMAKGLYDELQNTVPDLRLLLEKNRAEPSRVYAADGSLLAEFNMQQRDYIPLDELKVRQPPAFVPQPGRLIAATLSMEDSRFYTHPGTDAKRIVGAMIANYEAGGQVKQGGSTITEQLVKNVYQTNKRSVSRRLTSTMLALQLERKLSKDEILEAYLNEIPYGNRAYGCEAGAQTYFGKHAKDLTIAEAALLAGLPQAPSSLNPFKHYDKASARQKLVLHEMWEKKRINWGQYQEALKDKNTEKLVKKQAAIIKAKRANPEHWKSPYFVSYVREYLRKNYGYNLDEPGLKIYTSLDPKIQKIAERELSQGVASHGSKLQGALVSIDPKTGQVVAMVGGRDANPNENGGFNRAVQAKRQPGSTMKPYIYAAAMEAGLKPSTEMSDSELWVCANSECPPGKRSKRRGGHEVRNYTRGHAGTMPLETALAKSNNVIATKVLLKVGIQTAVEKAHLMGIQSPLDPVPSLALGTSGLSLLEHVSAYGVFATKGLRAEPTPVVRVENYNGDVLLEQPSSIRASRVLSQNAANEMYLMLRNVVTNGTGKPVGNALPGMEIIGKTGTTSANKDVWFMGASPELVTGVWMGYDTPKPLGYGSAGGAWCGPVFADFMRAAVPIWKNRPDKSMQKLVEDKRATEQQRYQAALYKQNISVRICKESGLLATKYCPDTEMRQFQAAGGAPRQFCDIHTRETTQPRGLDEGADKGRAGDLGYDPARDNNADSNDKPPADDGFPPATDAPPMNSAPDRQQATDNQQAPAYQGDSGVVLDNGSPQSLDKFDENAPVRNQRR